MSCADKSAFERFPLFVWLVIRLIPSGQDRKPRFAREPKTRLKTNSIPSGSPHPSRSHVKTVEDTLKGVAASELPVAGHFSNSPPPNRTCDFHRIRLSSVEVGAPSYRPPWMSWWHRRQTTNVLRFRPIILLIHSGFAFLPGLSMSASRRMWWTWHGPVAPQSSH
jgi:hypothetical protein